MEQNISSSNSSGNNKQGGAKAWKIATAATSVVAICGIGLGVYGIIQGQQKNGEITELKSQVESFKTGSTTTTTESTLTLETETVTDEAPSSDNLTCSKEYICIDQWGIKIKLSGGLSVLYTYAVNGDSNQEFTYIALVDSDTKSKLRASDITGTIPGTYIVRTTAKEIDPLSMGAIKPIFTDGKYNFFAYQPTGYSLDESLLKYDSQINKAFNNAFNNIFNKTGSYSKI